ncbi:hypothetical protein WDU94_006394 [Cyamophila willieti]
MFKLCSLFQSKANPSSIDIIHDSSSHVVKLCLEHGLKTFLLLNYLFFTYAIFSHLYNRTKTFVFNRMKNNEQTDEENSVGKSEEIYYQCGGDSKNDSLQESDKENSISFHELGKVSKDILQNCARRLIGYVSSASDMNLNLQRPPNYEQRALQKYSNTTVESSRIDARQNVPPDRLLHLHTISSCANVDKRRRGNRRMECSLKSRHGPLEISPPEYVKSPRNPSPLRDCGRKKGLPFRDRSSQGYSSSRTLVCQTTTPKLTKTMKSRKYEMYAKRQPKSAVKKVHFPDRNGGRKSGRHSGSSSSTTKIQVEFNVKKKLEKTRPNAAAGDGSMQSKSCTKCGKCFGGHLQQHYHQRKYATVTDQDRTNCTGGMRRSVSVYDTNIKQRLPLCLPIPHDWRDPHEDQDLLHL